MLKIVCSLCECSDNKEFFQEKLRTYFRCSACRLIFVLPESYLSEAAEKAEYDLHRNTPDDPGYRKFLSRIFCPMNERLHAGSHGLDFGSGSGPTLSVMLEEAGHNMEIFDKFYAHDLTLLNKQYDFITATEVVEHLHKPKFELNRLWSCLKLGGWLGIMTKLALGADEFKSWHYKNDMTHVCFFSKNTFQWLADHLQAELIFADKDVVLFQKNMTKSFFKDSFKVYSICCPERAQSRRYRSDSLNVLAYKICFKTCKYMVGGLFFYMKKKTDKGKIPHYSGHRERLRGRYLQSPQSFADYELLELLLTYAIPRKDVKEMAKELIAKYGSISGVLSASPDNLLENKGISNNSAVLFQLVKEFAAKLFADDIKEKDLFLSPAEALDFAKAKLAGCKDEVFLVIYVNVKNRMEDFEVINEGTVNHVVIYPRKVIKQALKHNATGLIVIHNHPSGECDPSGADIRLTESLKKAANAMDIKLIDHMIIAGNNYFSFLEEELL